MVSENRRAYYRARMQIPLRWRVLLPDETGIVRQGSGKTLLRGSRAPSPVDEFLQQASPGSKEEQLLRCLQLINNKLDFLIEHVFLAHDESSPSRGDLIDISGSGLKFSCREHVPMGSLLKMDLVMPATSQYQVEMICEVLRIEAHQRGFLVACKIIEIEEGARESIINVVFQQQRIDIRNARQGKEGSDAD